MNYENGEGVHLKSPLNAEFTLCGDAFDITSVEMCNSAEDAHLEIQPTSKKTITCPRCIAIILHCRGVKVCVKKD